MKNFTIIFRSTNSCNLNCTYCYDKNNHNNMWQENQKFTTKIPEIINNIKKLWEDKEDDSEIIFHGGEPLIINAENYDILMSNIKKIYPKVRFSIQTNATLLNRGTIRILKKHNVHIGISIDGYDIETNQCRIYKSGKNSFEDVIKKIELLQKEKISFGIIMTLTKNVLNKENKLYEFLRKNKLKCNIRPAFQYSDNENMDLMNNEEYYGFFKTLFNIWIDDNGEDKVKLMQIREIYDEFAKVLEPQYNDKSCSASGRCFMNFISLDCDGNLYSCNRTYRNKEFYYGNIRDVELDTLKRKMKREVENRNERIKRGKCKLCKLYEECRGGCPANAYIIHNDKNYPEDVWCEAKIKIREYIENYLDKNGMKKYYKEMKK